MKQKSKINKTIKASIAIAVIITLVLPVAVIGTNINKENYRLLQLGKSIEGMDISTIYVDDDNTEGPWVGTLEHPYQFIQDAVETTSQGDTIFIFDGSYTLQNIIVDKTLTIRGQSRENTQLSCGNGYYYFKFFSNNNRIENIGFMYGGTPGALVFKSSNNTVRHCNFYYASSFSIYCDGTTNTSNNNYFYNLYTYKSGSVKYIHSDNNTLENSTFDGWSIAVIHSSSYNLIQNCEWECLITDGIKFDSGSQYDIPTMNNCIRDCNINGSINSHFMFFGDLAQNNTIYNNSVNNFGTGITFWPTEKSRSSVYNKIYHNKFTNIYNHIFMYGTVDSNKITSNMWDNGYPSGGNFWDDYISRDVYSGPNQDISGPDGIGDSQHLLFQDSDIEIYDKYPLFWLYEDICGDINDDGAINVSDAVFIINYIFAGGPAPEPLCIGDANGDGTVNVSDAVYIINYVFSGGEPPMEGCCD